ncbi:Uricase-like [Oopsacas minuta]|uniref:Uricase n=1 Tax=Oopsacas minuta TaxID=111878 RepID=A0AAV7JAQ6_9METZ|nr:Uricase-like [Oopsacas minuta]
MSSKPVIFNQTSYGKAEVGVLYVHRHDKYRHSITDFQVTVSLTLATFIDYTHGDNSDIVATDTTKNTIYFLAHQHPEALESPERFGILICTHFLTKYQHILNCNVYVETNGWKRAVVHGKEHAHAFIGDSSIKRFTTVSKPRGQPFRISSGFKNLKLLKTTQSGFEGFMKDELTSLTDTKDRIFATSATINYEFNSIDSVNFNDIWEQVLRTVVESFSGPYDTGVYSSSVQHTMYLTNKRVLEEHKIIEQVEMNMPNIHYFLYDLTKIGVKGNTTTLFPAPLPYGHISCKLGRSVLAKL